MQYRDCQKIRGQLLSFCYAKQNGPKFRLLGRRFKSKTSMVAFFEMLPVPQVGPGRQAEL